MFAPTLSLPVRTLDLPLGGQGYGPHVLPFVFDLVNLVNGANVRDSSRKAGNNDVLKNDEDGSETIKYLRNVRDIVRRICSNYPSSLGLHPALYFYSRNGVFQSASLLGIISLFRAWQTKEFIEFTNARREFENFLLAHRGMTEAIRRLGSGARSRPRVVLLHQTILKELKSGKTAEEASEAIAQMPDFSFLNFEATNDLFEQNEGKFDRSVKGAAFLRDAIPSAPRCPTCGGFMHRNGMQAGHRVPRRGGGAATVENAAMQHPFCNSTVDN